MKKIKGEWKDVKREAMWSRNGDVELKMCVAIFVNRQIDIGERIDGKLWKCKVFDHTAKFRKSMYEYVHLHLTGELGGEGKWADDVRNSRMIFTSYKYLKEFDHGRRELTLSGIIYKKRIKTFLLP